ncbi:MAG: hemerythrin domain-containing protein [Bryobacterales bacterium]|nr:hemerythrin domain-containing protein [Bryobacterales bacterium]
MRITQALLGEHGAIYPLLELIERTAASSDLGELKIRAGCLQSALGSHANLEDELLVPAIRGFLPPPPVSGDGAPIPTDHEVIDSGLSRVLSSLQLEEARRSLLDTVAETRKHFLKEETIIFQLTERELSRELQEQLGAEWARRRGVRLS